MLVGLPSDAARFPSIRRARELFHEKFFDPQRYRLGRVGRFRLNRKLRQDGTDKEMTLRPEDLISAVKYLIDLLEGNDRAQIDDIDDVDATVDEWDEDDTAYKFFAGYRLNNFLAFGYADNLANLPRQAESPRPMPQIVRLPYISLSVANWEAMTVQSRVPGLVTIGPTITRSVSARIFE